MGASTKVKAWKFGDPAAPSFPSDYEVVDKIMLQCTDLKSNSNKFYALELHKANNKYRLFTDYGKTGATNTAKECRFYDYESDAKKDYNTIIKEKTNPKKKGGPYDVVELQQAAKGSDKAKTIVKVEASVSAPTIVTSKLNAEVQSLVKQIYEESGSKLSFMLNSSAVGATEGSPLGSLSFTQIDKGLQKLIEIRKVINGQPNDRVVDLSSDYFKAIPRKFYGRTDEYSSIYTIEKADEEEEFLQLLKDSLQVQKGFASGIDTKYDEIGADIEFLSKTDPEWIRIAQKIATTQDPGHNHTVEVNRIFRVKTNASDHKYTQDIHDICGMELYHGSRSANIVGILKNSLRIKPAGVVTAGSMFGAAVYAADQVTKSTNYSLSYWGGSGNKGNNAFVFLCDVAVGKMHEVYDSHYFTAPPRGYHSVKGCKGRSLRNNEYMVYHPNQVRLRYLVDFTPKMKGRGW